MAFHRKLPALAHAANRRGIQSCRSGAWTAGHVVFIYGNATAPRGICGHKLGSYWIAARKTKLLSHAREAPAAHASVAVRKPELFRMAGRVQFPFWRKSRPAVQFFVATDVRRTAFASGVDAFLPPAQLFGFVYLAGKNWRFLCRGILNSCKSVFFAYLCNIQIRGLKRCRIGIGGDARFTDLNCLG